MNKLQKLKKVAWIFIATIVGVFFAVALIVYFKAEPESVSELLPRSSERLTIEQLCKASGDIDCYPYVTKVYQYETSAERLEIKYVKNQSDADMNYGVIEDNSLSCNYLVEFYAYNNVADKDLVKRRWNISALESNGLILTKTDTFNVAQDGSLFNDLKKRYSRSADFCTTFARIRVKSGCNDIDFDNIIFDTDS